MLSCACFTLRIIVLYILSPGKHSSHETGVIPPSINMKPKFQKDRLNNKDVAIIIRQSTDGFSIIQEHNPPER